MNSGVQPAARDTCSSLNLTGPASHPQNSNFVGPSRRTLGDSRWVISHRACLTANMATLLTNRQVSPAVLFDDLDENR